MNELKMDSLRKFEEEMMKQKDETSENWAMKNIIIRLIQNLKIILLDIKVTIVYHINQIEVVKI